MSVQPFRPSPRTLELLDQGALPGQERWVRCDSAGEVARAIREMVVRGAPAIAIAAAYGLAVEARRGGDLEEARQLLATSRPTAVNLRWALERLANLRDPDALYAEAARIHREDLEGNRALGDCGASVLPESCRVYHHCNTGALATGGWGTALGVVRSVAAAGRSIHVWVGETRPWLQGARLTTWELAREGIDHTLVVDGAAAALMAAGRVDAVLVGCDRVAANGDTANKIGTYSLAVLARHHRIPLYVCMPSSTLDRTCPDGSAIPVEERSGDEVRGHGTARWAPDSPVYNPAFDITPAALVTAWVTEHGTWRPGHDDAGAGRGR